MEVFTDVALLSRIQFALTVAYHFIFVPLSIGLGLIVAIMATKHYRAVKRGDPDAAEQEQGVRFWVKLFTATFAMGVATGITMEFSFGTNWANYSRFVGDIFGAPLAAEALFAFFLESVFLGVLLFGRKRVSLRFYTVAAWLVWLGSCLSALWILIANSWMQTPAGAELAADGSKAVITDFLASAIFNPSILARYSHVVVALLIMGAFVAMAVAAWYMHKGVHNSFAVKTMRVGAVVGIVATCAMVVTAHASAVLVAEEQPTKLAMMEGMYEDEEAPLYLFGWVDEESQEVIAPFSIPGGTSWLASGDSSKTYEGMNTLSQTEQFGSFDPENAPVNFVFQSYHLMVMMFGVIMVCAILAIVFSFRKTKITEMKWLQKLLVIAPIFPFIAIQVGWITAEVGRQPWVVYPSNSNPDPIGVSLLTNDAISMSLTNVELIITLVLFIAIYAFLLVGWIRIVGRFIKQGPVAPETTAATAGDAPAINETAASASTNTDEKGE